MEKKRILSGIQPSGELHIGNYLGALKNWVDIQFQFESFFMIADEHAITVPYNSKDLRLKVKELTKIYIACGIDLKHSIIFRQSDIDAHTHLAWLLNTITTMGMLSRMTQYKEKSKGKNVGAGLFNYPVLMAADILIYDPHFVPTGDDQKQHDEFARDIAQKFNTLYGKVFTVPEPLIQKEGARIMSLTNPFNKMSKSDPNENSRIYLLDSKEVAAKKIKKAVTDSIGTIEYDKKNRPGISNLITIYSLISGESISKIENQYEDKGYKEFKEDLADIVLELLENIKKKYISLDDEYVEGILKEGAANARQIANLKLEKVKSVMGLN